MMTEEQNVLSKKMEAIAKHIKYHYFSVLIPEILAKECIDWMVAQANVDFDLKYRRRTGKFFFWIHPAKIVRSAEDWIVAVLDCFYAAFCGS